MFSGMVFRKEPFFKGRNNQDQLLKIVSVLGSNDFAVYLKKYELRLDDQLNQMVGRRNFPKKKYMTFVTHENKKYISADCLDLVDKLLQYDHALRLTPKEAMQHPYFKPIREYKAKQASSSMNTSSGDPKGMSSESSNSVDVDMKDRPGKDRRRG